MVAAIRRDQPWVERTIPKIGRHEVICPSSAGRVGAALTALVANGRPG